jgi:hypothetical protein
VVIHQAYQEIHDFKNFSENGQSILVVGVLSFFSLPRELADENGRANSLQGEAESERI